MPTSTGEHRAPLVQGAGESPPQTRASAEGARVDGVESHPIYVGAHAEGGEQLGPLFAVGMLRHRGQRGVSLHGHREGGKLGGGVVEKMGGGPEGQPIRYRGFGGAKR